MKDATFNGYKVHLIESVSDIDSMLASFSPKVMCGIDTETSGLEFKEEQVAGICLSGGSDYTTNGYRGFYLPIRHVAYTNNIPVNKAIGTTQYILDNFKSVFFNRNFDLSMMEYDGLKVPFVGGMQDCQIMAYLLFNEPYPALKDYSKRFLKWDMIEFSENSAENNNFKTTDPSVSFVYAAGDPIATVMLARKLWSDYPYIRKIYKIDNYTLEAVRLLCQNEITLDYDFLEPLKQRTEERLKELQTKIYSLSGVYGFNIDSTRDRADVLSRFVTLTEKTKTGKFKTDEEALSKLNHPIANLMIEYGQTRTFLKTFVAKMCSFKGKPVRINYNTVNVPSGRLSSGTSSGNPYFVPMNGQNIPKEEVKLFLHRHPVLGYSLEESEEGCVRDKEGNPIRIKTKAGLHRAFIAHDPDWFIMSSDYCLDPDSLVITECGVRSLRQLKDMPEGTRVWTPWGMQKTYDVRYTGMRKKVKIRLKTGETLICSPEHKLGVIRDGKAMWVRVKDLLKTDYVVTSSDDNSMLSGLLPEEGSSSEFITKIPNVTSVEVFDEEIEMMDLGVENTHCLYCNGVLVHNCAQEMRLAANFSKEPNFVDPILGGNDIHNYVAKSMYGYEDPSHRTKVKVLNFACLYGAEGPTIAQRLGVSVEEGKSLLAHYKATMSKLYAWRAEVIKQCRRRGYSLTYFGRPVYLLKYYNSSNKRDIAYADRLSVNSTIQGCIHEMTYVPTQNGRTVSTIRQFVGDRIQFAKDEKGLSRIGVPTYRGTDLCYFVEFKSGDFMVVSRFHKFLRYNSEFLVGLDDLSSGYEVQFVKPNKKVKFWKALFSSLFVKSDSLTVLSVSLKDPMPCDSLSVAVTLFKGWLSRDQISLSDSLASTFRSFVDLYGYNLVRTRSGKFRLKWSRPKKSKCRSKWPIGNLPVVSPSMISGYQTYPLSGIIHKNTGADLMRLFLIKFTMLNKKNQEWRDNTRMILPVHDEQNLEVHRSYLYKAWKLMKQVMEFHPDNFLVPMTVDTGIGTSWGNCLDASCISLDNRIVPAGVDPEMLEGDELAYYVDIVKHCKEEDLPEKLKKYFNA